MLVLCLVNRAVTQLKSYTREKLRKSLVNLSSYFSKNFEGTAEGKMEMTKQSFINAKKDDIELLIKQLK